MAIAREVATVTRLGIEVNHQHLCIVFLSMHLFLFHFSLNLLQLMVAIDIIHCCISKAHVMIFEQIIS